MSTRREFIKTIGGALAVATASKLLTGCAAGLATFHGELQGETITIPKAQAFALAAANGIMMVNAKNLPVAIVVRRLADNSLTAVSTVCTHAGCEVRVLPDAFECPCHGSEYDVTGEVIEGPAAKALQKFAVTENQDMITIKVRS